MWKAKFYRSASRGASLKEDRFFRHRRALAEYGDGRRGDGEGVARHHVPADISQLVPFSACFPLSRGAALPQGRKDSANGRSGHLRRELRPPMSPGILSFFGFCSGKGTVFPFFRKKSSSARVGRGCSKACIIITVKAGYQDILTDFSAQYEEWKKENSDVNDSCRK